MAIKLADTLAPMADFPAVEAKDVAFSDAETLQEKYDNGELDGGTNITVDSAMSDISTNPVQNKAIKEYVDNKSTNVSEIDGNAIIKKSDGLFVEDLSNKVNALNIAQKTINEDLDYCFVGFWNNTNSEVHATCTRGAAIPFNTKFEGNLDFNSTNKAIKLKAGHRYKLHYQCKQTGTTVNANHMERFYNETTSEWLKMACNCDTEDETHTMEEIYVPTVDCEVSVRNCWCPVASFSMRVNCINTNPDGPGLKTIDCESAFIVTEIGKTVTIDPVEYVNSTKGIEDTPVGEIIRTIGNKTPKHYLMCDGSTHNIADYPYLAQYFKDTFGAINVFGGDGTTTFGVPDYTTEKKLNTQYMAPNAWASSVYSSNYEASKAFNGTLNTRSNYWQTAENITLPVEIGIDLGSEYYITRYALHNLGWSTIVINDRPNTWDFEGSNDKINWNTIDTVTNYTWTNNTPEFKVSIPGSYRYYRLIIKTCVGTGISGVAVAPILNQILLYYSNSNFTHIKAEPTYFMQNTFNTNSVYSTDEMIIGRWIDGKPLYRKVIQGNITSKDQSLFVVNENIKTMISIYGYDSPDGIYYFPFNYTQNGSTQKAIFYKKDTDTIEFRSNSFKSGEVFVVILEYTKTTD